MEHVAIMKKSWGLLGKILSGEKTIESRWYKNRYRPWGKIKTGERVFFKNSGEPMSVKARVKKVLQFSNLTPVKVKTILEKYGQADGIEKEKLDYFYELFKDKKYCILIFLKDPVEIEPFEINKTGLGAMAAWIIVDSAARLKRD